MVGRPQSVRSDGRKPPACRRRCKSLLHWYIHGMLRINALRVAAVLVAVLGLANCRSVEDAPPDFPIRLALPNWWGEETLVPPQFAKDGAHGTISDDTRMILPATAETLMGKIQAEEETAGAFGETDVSNSAWRDASHLAVVYRVKNKTWSAGRPVVGEIVPAEGTDVPKVRFPIDRDEAALPIIASAHLLPISTRLIHRSKPLTVPEGATLEAALGNLLAFGPQARAEYGLDACLNGECKEIFQQTVTAADTWEDVRVDLDELKTQSVIFQFWMEDASDEGSFVVPAWSDPMVEAGTSPGTPDKPNVILISLDTLRADHLGVYGYHLPTSPKMDRLFGEGGTVFERCVSSAGSTLPSHMSMFTSIPPTSHGVEATVPLSKNIPTLAEVLSYSGIKTGAFTENGWLGKDFGFYRGFQVFLENKGPDTRHSLGYFPEVLAGARDWLDRNSDKHFFLFLHTFQVHDPYAPPAEYVKLVDDPSVGSGDDVPRHVRERLAYDREIRYTDDLLAEFIEHLDASGLGDRTVVIVTSDHGEEFGDHGHLLHGLHLYEEIVRVPFLLRGPGVPRGKRIADNVTLLDIMPTILSLMGVATPEHLTGIDLVDVWKEDRTVPRRLLYSEHWSSFAIGIDRKIASYQRPSFSVVDGDLKLMRYKIRGQHEYRFHDTKKDPQEIHPLAPEGAEFERLRKALDEYYDLAVAIGDDIRARLSGDETGNTRFRPDSDMPPIDAEREEKLRALGYIQ